MAYCIHVFPQRSHFFILFFWTSCNHTAHVDPTNFLFLVAQPRVCWLSGSSLVASPRLASSWLSPPPSAARLLFDSLSSVISPFEHIPHTHTHIHTATTTLHTNFPLPNQPFKTPLIVTVVYSKETGAIRRRPSASGKSTPPCVPFPCVYNAAPSPLSPTKTSRDDDTIRVSACTTIFRAQRVSTAPRQRSYTFTTLFV